MSYVSKYHQNGDPSEGPACLEEDCRQIVEELDTADAMRAVLWEAWVKADKLHDDMPDSHRKDELDNMLVALSGVMEDHDLAAPSPVLQAAE